MRRCCGDAASDFWIVIGFASIDDDGVDCYDDVTYDRAANENGISIVSGTAGDDDHHRDDARETSDDDDDRDCGNENANDENGVSESDHGDDHDRGHGRVHDRAHGDGGVANDHCDGRCATMSVAPVLVRCVSRRFDSPLRRPDPIVVFVALRVDRRVSAGSRRRSDSRVCRT